MLKKNLVTALLFTVATTVLLGLVYPVVITGLARLWPDKANGQLIIGMVSGRLSNSCSAIYGPSLFSP